MEPSIELNDNKDAKPETLNEECKDEGESIVLEDEEVTIILLVEWLMRNATEYNVGDCHAMSM